MLRIPAHEYRSGRSIPNCIAGIRAPLPLAAVVLAVVVALGSANCRSYADFDTSAFTYKMKIQFAGYRKTEPLTNFPALVVFSNNVDDSGFAYSQFAATNGYELRFGNSNETAALNYESEQWDPSGSSYVWVQVPRIASSNDYVWTYWGNPKASATSSAAVYTTNGATWSAGYRGVWHLNRTNRDSTAYANHGTNNNSIVPGRISGAQGFDGSTANIVLPNNGSLNITSSITVAAWLYSTAAETYRIAYSAGTGSTPRCDFGILNKWGTEFVASPNWYFLEGSTVVDSQWRHLVFVFDDDSNKTYLYENGVRVAGANDTGTLGGSDEFRIGCKYDNTLWWHGLIDEMRVSGAARSSNWVWACHMNQASNSLFNTHGEVCRRKPGTVFVIR